MKDFVQLFEQLDQTTKTNKKVAALKQYFDAANDTDKLWTIAILSHRRPKRSVRTALLREWASEAANLPLWLFEESYHIVGDLAETIALIHPNPIAIELESKNDKTLSEWIQYIVDLKPLSDEEQKERVLRVWNQLNEKERFVFNKLLTGGWRVGLSQKLMTRALAQHAEVEENALTHRLMGNWRAETTSYHELIESSDPADQYSKPYPFYLAYAVEGEVQDLGDVADWQAEWKWDGIRGQIIIRNNELFVWSRGEELVTDKFPEFQELVEALPNGTVLDGEIIPFKEGKPLNFATMQTRISRKNVSKAILKSAPIVMIAYDILELDGQDLRETPMEERRKLLMQLVKNQESEKLMLSQVLDLNSWEKLIEVRSKSRENNAEGLMLKRKDSTYKIGRKKGDWWKWKVDPLTIDAVMIYAMRGHGRRANLYTDYTFAVWDGEKLVPFAKAYSGLTDKEIKRVDAFVKKNTVDKFGPVRSVTPELVFEIAFEGIARSSRHKSGVALRFPRIHRWREDKPAAEANTMEDLMKMLAEFG